LTEAEIDELVRPILAIKVKMGLFEHPYTDETLLAQVVSRPEHRQASRWAAQRSMVLLRNEGGLLPLKKDLKKVAVIGPLADSMEATEGSWMVFGHTPAAVTVLAGLRAKLPAAQVTYAHGPEIRRDIPSWFETSMAGMERKPAQSPADAEAAFQAAIETARAADLVVMVLGETAEMAGEAASRASLDLPGRQEELLKAVAALGKPVVLVLLNGRPLSINWAAEHIPAILEAWEPGTEGGSAVADILFGDAVPGGKLPVCFPHKGSHAPLYYARNLDAKRVPVLFPFGYGLSYTCFAYSNVRASAAIFKDVEGVTVSVDVTNTGCAAGKEIVQVYVHDRESGLARPEKELKGFAKVALEPGETKSVSIPLDFRAFAYYHPKYKQWITEDGEFDILIAASADDIRQVLTVNLESTLSLPCILDKESTIREWMDDRRGKVVFGPYYEQIQIQSRQTFGGGEGEGSIGVDVMEMMNDMPLVSVLMFMASALPVHPEDMVAGLLKQVHGME